MYFSMQLLRQLFSRPDSELPGLGTQWAKQFSFTLLIRYLAFITLDCVVIAVWSRALIAPDSDVVTDDDVDADGEPGPEPPAAEEEEDEEENGLEKKDILSFFLVLSADLLVVYSFPLSTFWDMEVSRTLFGVFGFVFFVFGCREGRPDGLFFGFLTADS